MAARRTEAAGADLGIEHVPWADFLGSRFVWRQYEHVSLIGPTGTGKTTLARGLLAFRRRSVIYATKPKDATLAPLLRRRPPEGMEHYKRLREWPPGPTTRKVILWPKGRNIEEDAPRQQRVFHAANQALYRSGAWAVLVDDLWFHCQILKLARDYEMLLANGRSLNLSVLGCIQRPRGVPLMFYDQPTHLFFWNDPDEDNRKRIASIGHADPKLVRQLVARLARHQTLYVNTRTGEMLTTKAERFG